jgi:hypothetical protein
MDAPTGDMRQWYNVQPVVHESLHHLNGIIREHNARINHLTDVVAQLHAATAPAQESDNNSAFVEDLEARLRALEERTTRLIHENAAPSTDAQRPSRRVFHGMVNRGEDLVRWCPQGRRGDGRLSVEVLHSGFVTLNVAVVCRSPVSPRLFVNKVDTKAATTVTAIATIPHDDAQCALQHTKPFCEHAARPEQEHHVRCAACENNRNAIYTVELRLHAWMPTRSKIAVRVGHETFSTARMTVKITE